MTTRDQSRRGRRGPRGAIGRATGVSAEPDGPTLPERLYAARERKGVDLYRAERDTKIRARYLAALERGDYARAAGRRLHEGLPAQLRALPRPRPRGRPPPVAPRARRRVRRQSRLDRRPAAAPGAAPGPHVLARRRRRGAADRRVIALRGLPRRPAPPVRQAADARGDRPGTARSLEVDGGHDRVHAAGHVDPGRHGHDRRRRSRAALPRVGRRDRPLDRRRRPPARPEPVRRSARSTPRPASRGEARRRCSSPCRSSSIEAPTLTVDQPADGASSRTGRSRSRASTTNASTVASPRRTSARRPRASRPAVAAAPPSASGRRRRRSPTTVQRCTVGRGRHVRRRRSS